MIGCTVQQVDLPLAEAKVGGWVPYPLIQESTPSLSFMGCHVSVLSPGYCPHPLQGHIEEELLIVLDGEAQIEIGSGPEDQSPRIETLVPGQFSYYPAWQHHTLRNMSLQPVSYMIFKWTADKPANISALPAGVFDYRPHLVAQDSRGFAPRTVLNSPTGWLKRLHCHLTLLQPGAGYDPHVDPYDVAIVMLVGKVETIGHVLGPCDVVYYGAGEMHGLNNPSQDIAKYLVFEFDVAGQEDRD